MRDTEPLNLPQELVFGVKIHMDRISPFSLSLDLFPMARDTLWPHGLQPYLMNFVANTTQKHVVSMWCPIQMLESWNGLSSAYLFLLVIGQSGLVALGSGVLLL